MHVKELRAALHDIEEVFSAAGAKALQKDLGALVELLDENDNLDLSAFLEVLRRNLSGPPQLSSDEWVKRLNEVGLDEDAFIKAFGELGEALSSKVELRKIAESYTGNEFKTKASKQDLMEGIKSEFYGRVYDQDADKIGKRATPW